MAREIEREKVLQRREEKQVEPGAAIAQQHLAAAVAREPLGAALAGANKEMAHGEIAGRC
jgi:hypothetical protein